MSRMSRKCWAGHFCWLDLRNSNAETDQGIYGINASPTCLGWALVMKPAELSDVAVKHELFRDIQGLFSREQEHRKDFSGGATVDFYMWWPIAFFQMGEHW